MTEQCASVMPPTNEAEAVFDSTVPPCTCKTHSNTGLRTASYFYSDTGCAMCLPSEQRLDFDGSLLVYNKLTGTWIRHVTNFELNECPNAPKKN